MRTQTAQELAVYGGTEQAYLVRVLVADSGGTERDLDEAAQLGGQEWLVAVRVSEEVDGEGPTADITVRRNIFTHNLSPLMSASGAAFQYGNPLTSTSARALDLNRRVRVQYALSAGEAVPESNSLVTTWTTIFLGRIDRISVAEGEEMVLECRDETVAQLADAFFEVERYYGLTPSGAAVQRGAREWTASTTLLAGDVLVPPNLNGYVYRVTVGGTTGTTEPTWATTVGATFSSGTATLQNMAASATSTSMEVVLQQMMNDSPRTLSQPTLYAPDAPGFQITPYLQSRTPILEAMRQVAQVIGWDVRPRWVAASSAFRTTLYKPDRAKTTPDATFGPTSYTDVAALDLSIEDIRNVVAVYFSDSAELGTDGKSYVRKASTVSDATSISAYGRRYMELSEDISSQVDTLAEATTLANAALSDLSTPYADMEVEAFFWPWAEVGDLYRFSPNGVHFDANQDLAVVGLAHQMSVAADGETVFRTTLSVRGKPSGGSKRWLQWDGRPGVAEVHNVFNASGGGTLSLVDAAGVAGGAKFRVNEKLQRLAKFDGVEIHISESAGFTPSSATLATVGKMDSLEVQNLKPGKTYYARAVPRQLNAGRIVLGKPTDAISFTAGYTAARMLQPGVDYGAVPPNGGFEAWTAGTTTPPDAWAVRAGTWDTTMSRYTNTTSGFGNGGSGSYSVSFVYNAISTLESITFASLGPVRVTANALFYHPTTTPAANSVRVDVEWLNAAGTLLSTGTLDLSSVSGQEFVQRNVELTPPAGAAYGRVVCGRFSTAAASESFILSDVRVDRLIVPGDADVGTAQLADDSVTLAKVFFNTTDASTTVGGSTAVVQVGNSSVTTGTMSGYELFANGGLGANANRLAGIYGIYKTYGVANAGGDMVLATAKAGGVGAGLYERVRIDQDGNVGIGCVPSTVFHVRDSSGGNAIIMDTGATTGVQLATLIQDGTTTKWQTGKDADNSWFLWDAAASRTVIRAYSNSYMALMQSGGFAGVGTSAPVNRWDIATLNNWDLTNTEGDMRVGDATYRLKVGIANAGGGAGSASIAAVGGVNVLKLGSGTTSAKQAAITITDGTTVITEPAWIAPTLLNSFTNYNTTTYQAAGYYRDSSGRVFLRGLVARASAALNTAIFNLPAGYRPAKQTLFGTMANNFNARLDIDTSGNVFISAADNAAWYSFITLDGVNFDTRA